MKNLFFISISLLLLISCKTSDSRNNSRDYISITIDWGGYERLYLVHLPPENKRLNMPVLLHLHGGGGTAKGTIGLTFGRFNELADEEGFMVIYPQAIEKNWNDGRKIDGVKSTVENIDDVGFIAEIINEVKNKYSIDDSRIFTTGMSNGGFMSTRLLCDRADLFRGGAILTATLSETYFPECKPSKPTAVLVMNGTDDPLVPFNGGPIKVLKKDRGSIISTSDMISFWEKENGCTSKKPSKYLEDLKEDGTRVKVDEYANCNDRGALILYTIEGGGHTWPGGKQYLGEKIIGKTSRDINACDVIWDFFKRLD